jgi:tryptophanyl-tRNA synthetase
MAHTERLSEFVDRDYGRVSLPALQAAQILLRQAGSLGKLLLRVPASLSDSGAIVADQLPHIHAKSLALWRNEVYQL